MKKISFLALVLVLMTGLLAACTGTRTDETTAPGTDYATTGPQATNPTTAPTVAPTTAPTHSTDPTETTGGVNTLDPTGNGDGKMGPRMPGMR